MNFDGASYSWLIKDMHVVIIIPITIMLNLSILKLKQSLITADIN
jgi:hypothetical protein